MCNGFAFYFSSSPFLYIFKKITLAVVVTKFVGVRGLKVPFRMMNRYASRGYKKGEREREREGAFLDRPSERNWSLRELDANTGQHINFRYINFYNSPSINRW